MKIEDIKIGDRVMLTNGEKPMVVNEIFKDEFDKVTHLECIWEDFFERTQSTVIQCHKFSIQVLEPYENLQERKKKFWEVVMRGATERIGETWST